MAVRVSPSTDQPVSRFSVPKLIKDPVWSLCPWPLDVSIGTIEATIPAHPASVWLAILMNESWDLEDIFPGLVAEVAEDVDDGLTEEVFSLDDLQDLCLDILEIVSGRPYYVTLRLVIIAREAWDTVGAELILQHIDPSSISLSAWLDVLTLTILKNLDEDKRTMVLAQLEAPPPGEEITLEDSEMPRNQFLAMMSDIG